MALKQKLGRGNILSTIKELKKIKRHANRSVPASVQSFVNDGPRLDSSNDKEAVLSRRRILLEMRNKYNVDFRGTSLFGRLTVLHSNRQPYNGKFIGELFIHWYYRSRSIDRLSVCEIFHLNMLQYFNVMDKMEIIHVRCAYEGKMTGAMENAIKILSNGKARIDFKIVLPNNGWEHDTFKECVEHAVDSHKFVYYTHFKGVTHIVDGILKGSYRNKGSSIINPINIMYWCYVMYRYLFSDAPNGAKVIGPLFYPKRPTIHYSNRNITPKWSLPITGHYTGSFQAFDGNFLSDRFDALGAEKAIREKSLWVSDPYTVEQFLNLCFNPKEIATASSIIGAYHLYDKGVLPLYKKDFDKMYISENKNICVANGTYKWIGGTDTFNWALCKALLDMGYTVYYYAPDMDGKGVTEKYLQEIGVMPYVEGVPLIACFANQQSGQFFVGKCPVVQTCHSIYTNLELPIKGARNYVSISEEIQSYLKVRGFHTDIIRNGIDLQRYCPRTPIRESPSILSICQGDDSLLREACAQMGWTFHSVPKGLGSRIWHIEDLINNADLVVGIGRSLYDAMACGRACLSWDNRKLNPFTGCGYITADNWYISAKTNFTGRGFPVINTLDRMVVELKKYNPADGAVMRGFAEKELDMRKNVIKYLALAGITY